MALKRFTSAGLAVPAPVREDIGVLLVVRVSVRTVSLPSLYVISVPDSVANVLGGSAVQQVSNPVVERVPVPVPDLLSCGARTKENPGDKYVQIEALMKVAVG
jgi:hypothetical protein